MESGRTTEIILRLYMSTVQESNLLSLGGSQVPNRSVNSAY